MLAGENSMVAANHPMHLTFLTSENGFRPVFWGELVHDRPYVDGVIPHSFMSWRCRGVGSV